MLIDFDPRAGLKALTIPWFVLKPRQPALRCGLDCRAAGQARTRRP